MRPETISYIILKQLILWVSQLQNGWMSSDEIVKAIKENPSVIRKEFLLERFKVAADKSSNVKHNQFWRHDNKPIELWSNKVISEKNRYIRNNPVEEGLVLRPEDYRYSSPVDYRGEKGLLDGIVLVTL